LAAVAFVAPAVLAVVAVAFARVDLAAVAFVAPAVLAVPAVFLAPAGFAAVAVFLAPAAVLRPAALVAGRVDVRVVEREEAGAVVRDDGVLRAATDRAPDRASAAGVLPSGRVVAPVSGPPLAVTLSVTIGDVELSAATVFDRLTRLTAGEAGAFLVAAISHSSLRLFLWVHFCRETRSR
jgi:hypothetical protein